jgi:hypothetical protein
MIDEKRIEDMKCINSCGRRKKKEKEDAKNVSKSKNMGMEEMSLD